MMGWFVVEGEKLEPMVRVKIRRRLEEFPEVRRREVRQVLQLDFVI